jgi:hypothetical protein
MSMIRFTCPQCRGALRLAVAVPPGRSVKCPKCAAVFKLPAEKTAAAARAEPATESPAPAPQPGRTAPAPTAPVAAPDPTPVQGAPPAAAASGVDARPAAPKKRRSFLVPGIVLGVGVLVLGGLTSLSLAGTEVTDPVPAHGGSATVAGPGGDEGDGQGAGAPGRGATERARLPVRV